MQFSKYTFARPAALAVTGILAVGLLSVAGIPQAAHADSTQTVDDAVLVGNDSFGYDSSWGTATGVSDLYNGTAHWSNATGGVATFDFQGTHAAIRGVRDRDQGIVTFSVDHGSATTVDDYSATRVPQSTLFDTGTLAESSHTITITTTGTKNAASSGHTIALDSAVLDGPTQGAAIPTLKADLSVTGATFAANASGSLYGITQSGVPSDNLVAGMGLTTLATKAQDGQQHPGADALEVEPTFLNNGGQDEYIYMTDVYRNFPYERTSYSQYQGYLRTEVQQVLAAGANSHIVFVPYNEPEGNWFGGLNSTASVQAAFDSEWLQTFQLIRSLDPSARIAGPNLSWYYGGTISQFLTYCKANSCLPDVMTWHELGVPSTIRSHVAAYRAVERAVGVGPLPINLDEYAPPSALDNPGAMVPWISAIDDSGVQGDLAYWQVDGSLDDSIAQQNSPNAQWWLYNWYSRMTGKRVTVTSSQNNADGTPQGVATVDSTSKIARVILSGGGSTGAAQTVIKNIPSSVFGGTVHVTVQEDRWSGDTGVADAPVRLSDADVTVAANGSITVPLTLSAMSAYEITVQPGGTGSATTAATGYFGTYEAEAATLTGSGYNINTETSNATSGGHDVGGLRTRSTTVITFAVTVPTTADYNVRIFDGSNAHASAVNGPTNVFLRVDGGASQSVLLPASYNWVIWNNANATVHLTAGTHSLSLATTGDSGGATTGDAIVDKIDLSQITSSAATYEAEQAGLNGAGTSYVARGQSGAGTAAIATGQSATFWINSASDGYSDLALRYTGIGAASVAVNKLTASSLALSSSSATAWTTTTKALYLQKGINRVDVTGASGTVQLDDLVVTPHSASDALSTANVKVYQAEAGTLAGTASAVSTYSQANGSVVTGIGPGVANSLTLSVPAPAAGVYEMTLRFANAQELPSNHYNPDLMDRAAQFTVNGGTTQTVAFGPTYSWNQFFTVTVPVTLTSGTNTLKFWSNQQYNWDGSTIGVVYSGTGGVGSQMRANQSANLDQASFAPLAVG